MNIAIVNYGMGNIKSLVGALNFIGVKQINVTASESEINSADKIILPGVGSFKEAMQNIKRLNLDKILENNVLNKKKPLMGICLGMQLLLESSEEGGEISGLKFMKGKITRFDDSEMRVPHIGINQVLPNSKSKIYKDFSQKELDFYFVHSYKLEPQENIKQSKTHYVSDFVSSFEKNNIIGVQYHPELSQKNGLNILRSFITNF
tara:strand:- start:6168 stop:6782 length:615 start_codon:yes stop_codon:yes gene_type:complete